MNLTKIASKLEQECLLVSKVANTEERRYILKALKASNKIAIDEDVEEYKQVRLVYNMHNFRIEELPQKGKKKLRIFYFWLPAFQHNFGLLNMPNIIRYSNIVNNDSYESAKTKVEQSIKEVIEMSIKDKPNENPHQLDNTRGYEKEVNYLLIEPADTKPIKVEGKDFVVNSKWTEFTCYSPNSNLHEMEPSYSMYESKSASSARKFYKMMKTNPDALKAITWSEFSNWMRQNGIHYDIHNSVWH